VWKGSKALKKRKWQWKKWLWKKQQWKKRQE